MGRLGITAMYRMLNYDTESEKVLAGAIGKTITELWLGHDDALHFEFSDGTKMKLRDEGQSCCEDRYMRTDDNLADYVGAKLLGIEVKEAFDVETEFGEHEIEFLEVKTDRGTFTMASHNEHNGYYGGISLTATAE